MTKRRADTHPCRETNQAYGYCRKERRPSVNHRLLTDPLCPALATCLPSSFFSKAGSQFLLRKAAAQNNNTILTKIYARNGGRNRARVILHLRGNNVEPCHCVGHPLQRHTEKTAEHSHPILPRRQQLPSSSSISYLRKPSITKERRTSSDFITLRAQSDSKRVIKKDTPTKVKVTTTITGGRAIGPVHAALAFIPGNCDKTRSQESKK